MTSIGLPTSPEWTLLERRKLEERLRTLEAQLRRVARLSDARSYGGKFQIREPSTQIDGNVNIDGNLDVGGDITMEPSEQVTWDWGSGSGVDIHAYVPTSTDWQQLDIQSQNLRPNEDARIYINAATFDPAHSAIIQLRAGDSFGDAIWMNLGAATPFKLDTSELALTVPLSVNGVYSKEALPASAFYSVAGSPARGNLGASSALSGATWLLDDSVTECVGLFFPYQGDASGSTITVTVLFAMESATSGDVRIANEVLALADGEDATDSGDFIVNNVTVPGTAKLVKETEFAHSISYEPGDWIRLAIYRAGVHAADTATGDMHLIAVLATFS